MTIRRIDLLHWAWTEHKHAATRMSVHVCPPTQTALHLIHQLADRRVPPKGLSSRTIGSLLTRSGPLRRGGPPSLGRSRMPSTGSWTCGSGKTAPARRYRRARLRQANRDGLLERGRCLPLRTSRFPHGRSAGLGVRAPTLLACLWRLRDGLLLGIGFLCREPATCATKGCNRCAICSVSRSPRFRPDCPAGVFHILVRTFLRHQTDAADALAIEQTGKKESP